MRDWEKIRADFATGAYSLRELSARHKVEHSTINKRAKREEWEVIERAEVMKMIEGVVKIKEKAPHLPQFHKSVEDLADLELLKKKVAQKLYEKTESMIDEVISPAELKDLAIAFEKTSSPFKNDAPAVAIQNNSGLPALTIIRSE
jgi:hypothetical protein